MTELFEHSLATFVNSETVKQKMQASSTRPTWKTLRDRFKSLMSDHKGKEGRHTKDSGAEYEYNENAQLTDDIYLEMQEHEANKMRAKSDKNEKTDALERAGATMRNMALKRRADREEDGSKDTGESESRRIKSARSAAHDEELELISADNAHRQRIEEDRMRIEKMRVELEERREAREHLKENSKAQLAQQKMSMEGKMLDLKQKKFEADLDDRKRAHEEKERKSHAELEDRKMEREDKRLSLEERRASVQGQVQMLTILERLATKFGDTETNTK